MQLKRYTNIGYNIQLYIISHIIITKNYFANAHKEDINIFAYKETQMFHFICRSYKNAQSTLVSK